MLAKEIQTTLLNIPWVRGEISVETRKYFELNDSRNTTNEKLWDGVKAIPGRKFIVLNVYMRKKKGWASIVHLKKLEKEQQFNIRESRKKKIKKIIINIDVLETFIIE